MNYVQIPDYVYERLIKNLQQGIDVCVNVDYASDDMERSASYANGYSRATMKSVIDELNNYKTIKN